MGNHARHELRDRVVQRASGIRRLASVLFGASHASVSFENPLYLAHPPEDTCDALMDTRLDMASSV